MSAFSRSPWPRSLAGRMTLLIGLALLVAQLANFALLLNERQKLSLAQNEGPAITRFAGVAADIAQAQPIFRSAVIADNSHRGARFALAADAGIAAQDRDGGLEAKLRQALTDAGVQGGDVRATLVAPAARRDGRAWSPPPDMRMMRLAVKGGDGQWLIARIATPKRDPWFTVRIAAATLLLYLIVLGAAIWIARRLARPLRDLTNAAERFRGRDDPVAVEPSGPDDLRQAIEAFNAMNRRVIALLDEKDRMLGAIGHDLRTPLASLRIRVEAMEPEEEREAAVAKITEIIAMLEDILVLARSGRAREEARPMDVAALAEALVEEYRELGQSVECADSPRQVLAVQVNLLRRALRNLIDNALKYGGGAEVSVARTGDEVALRVADRGPGIAPDQLAQVLQPFYRLESSRSRATGGSGLGLAIAQAIAESHGGRLTLENRPEGGLAATLRFPAMRAAG
ncbi:sensor histidine kinase [Flavisphingomonas formosensis]|uniref:sensor histidine kinase n=1 Tax=Flavisphingomonas formosensis TaxID=861534 RepID=UPI0018E03D22|nr:HAMP domain-containing sensor histidine kinase [Sphingomonas formosensis]